MDAAQLPARSLVSVTEAPIDPAAVLAAVGDPGAGAVVLFLGTVRDHSEGRPGVTALEYEAYREVVEERIAAIAAEACRGHLITGLVAMHRVGLVSVGEISVAVAVSSAHRPDAFAVARRVIDELKATAPIWKKEIWEDGSEWVVGS